MTADIPFTAAQLEHGIANAIAAHDFESAITLLKLLMFVDADRAEIVYDTIMVGIEMSGRAAS